MGIKILLADMQTITREGIRTMLNNQPEMAVIEEAGNGGQVVDLVSKFTPDVVIMDVVSPVSIGVKTIGKIRSDTKNVKVIVLSGSKDEQTVKSLIQAGATGYLWKDCAFDELVTAIHSVVEGHSYLSPEATDILLTDYRNELSNKASSSYAGLSARQRQILKLIAEGMSIKKIATALGVSIRTVEAHLRHIRVKLGLNSVAELTKLAIRKGLTSLETWPRS